MPQKRDRLLRDMLNRPIGIVIAIGSGKDDDAEFHWFLAEPGILQG